MVAVHPDVSLSCDSRSRFDHDLKPIRVKVRGAASRVRAPENRCIDLASLVARENEASAQRASGDLDFASEIAELSCWEVRIRCNGYSVVRMSGCRRPGFTNDAEAETTESTSADWPAAE